jgi:hypothetical protein
MGHVPRSSARPAGLSAGRPRRGRGRGECESRHPEVSLALDPQLHALVYGVVLPKETGAVELREVAADGTVLRSIGLRRP